MTEDRTPPDDDSAGHTGISHKGNDKTPHSDSSTRKRAIQKQ
jgi:hypothetical protein